MYGLSPCHCHTPCCRRYALLHCRFVSQVLCTSSSLSTETSAAPAPAPESDSVKVARIQAEALVEASVNSVKSLMVLGMCLLAGSALLSLALVDGFSTMAGKLGPVGVLVEGIHMSHMARWGRIVVIGGGGLLLGVFVSLIALVFKK